MSLLGGLISGVLKGVMDQAGPQALPAILEQLLGKTQLGSVGGLLEQLQKAGLGDQVSSWLGRGANLPVSVDQLRDALGGDRLGELASQGGLSIDALLEMLSQNLPQTVDTMSPNGTLEGPGASGGTLGDQAGVNDIRT